MSLNLQKGSVHLGLIAGLVIFSIFAALLIFPKASSQAAGNINLQLTPSTASVAVGQTFSVNVVINAGTAQPTAAQLNIKFDPAVLQAVAFENGSFFNTSTFQGGPALTFNNTQGVAVGLLTVGPEPLGCAIQVINGLMPADQCVFNYKSGTATMATLQFKALKATNPTTAITFDTSTDKTQIAALHLSGNQLGTATGSTVTIPSPSVKPSPTPKPTPTPRSGSVIKVSAAGTHSGNVYPNMRLQIKDTSGTWRNVKTWNGVQGDPGARQFQEFAYTHTVKVTPDAVRVRFINDLYNPITGQDRNLVVDKINLDGVDIQSEGNTTYSQGSWSSDTKCRAGIKKSEWLHCNGFFEYR